jgi:hypothetical protein
VKRRGGRGRREGRRGVDRERERGGEKRVLSKEMKRV